MLRSLWWNDGDFRPDPYALSMCMNLFVASFSPGAVTYALRKIAVVRGSKYSPEASEIGHRDVYVDESVTSVFTVNSPCALIAEMQKVLAEGSCKCHRVISNSQEVFESVPTEGKTQVKDSNLH